MHIQALLAAIVALLLPTRSVDAIVSLLTKVADRLDAAEAAQNAHAGVLKLQALDLMRAANEASAEANRAARVRAKLAKLTE